MVGTCKHATEATDGNYVFMVGERSHRIEALPEGGVDWWEVKMPE
jgi:hypothetical protein